MEEFNDNSSDLDALVALPQACSESISLHKACQNAIYYLSKNLNNIYAPHDYYIKINDYFGCNLHLIKLCL